MCGVLGASIQNVTAADLDTIRKLFYESQIRGKHATGVTYYKDGSLVTIKEPTSAEEFIKLHDPADWVDGDTLTFIGHCRYSTSDLRYNQPIADDTLSLVHNGVISQELPDNWESLYGFKTETKNDSELLFHTLKEGHEPEYWEDASISAIWLTDTGSISYNRNGKRPLWIYQSARRIILASTEDVLKRSGITSGVYKVSFEGNDLQP